MAKKLVYGIGLNDADYTVSPTVNGKTVVCPFYLAWQGMLERCYSEKFQSRRPTYIGCAVCKEWMVFSDFKRWMQQQVWQNKALDKDLLVKGNKVYSPSTCVFVDRATNNFTSDRGAYRGEWPIGVNFDKRDGKFRAQCSNPFTGKNENLGYFNCPDQAHEVWKKRKHELALQLADLQTDSRVTESLRSIYL